MGRPYAAELAQLSATYEWAATVEISELAAAVAASANLPMLAVGSGGSLSAAHHASRLHQESTGVLARPVTPLELVRSRVYLGVSSLLFLSAGGTNVDIVGSLRNAIAREPRQCIVVCFRRGSPLSEVAAQYQFVHLVEMTPPVTKDGFLSTNSLVGFTVLLERAYAQVLGKAEVLPSTFDALLSSAGLSEQLAELPTRCRPLWKRDTLLVLHGPDVSAAAVDLESKFSESALGNVQLADFRNFAHGRHNWIAMRSDTTGVLALYSEVDRELAEATLELLPADVPVARISLAATGAPARVAALLAVLHTVGHAGAAHDIDPGRPHVPEFGRQIYHLQAFSKSRSGRIGFEVPPIARKVATDPHRVTTRPDFERWHEAFRAFVSSLTQATFGAILFDYDGTLCDGRDRFIGVREDVASALQRVLSAKVLIGIATGRGKSVRESLQSGLRKAQWADVLVGYYNCTDIAPLSMADRPINSGAPSACLAAAAELLARHPVMEFDGLMEVRPTQISIQAKSRAASESVWRVALDVVQSHRDLKIVRSSHSIDILQQSASKMALLNALSLQVAPKLVLCIGDMGRWPGNDHEILATQHALSVDDVSTALMTCWNLAPAGYRGVQATLRYLECLSIQRGSFTFDAGKLTARRIAKERS